ncbi:MAG: type IV pili methyl-accepting chemotaxis transducer N-terminal domain-containing protein [Pseudomonadales bacterium]|nr:type IV pili methyl-accepting chemotaxis transducer N-terminal domain-containing protein [Pseudomonadales bacterium]
MTTQTEQIVSTSQSNRTPLFGIGVVVFIVAAIFVFYQASNNADLATKYLAHSSELRVLSQGIAKNSTEAANGNDAAFALLEDSKFEFQLRWDKVKNGSIDEGLDPDLDIVQEASVEMKNLDNVWVKVSNNADVILGGQETVINLHDVAQALSETIPQLQEEYDLVVQILLENGAPAEQVAVAERQSLLAERIVRSVNRVLEGGEAAVMAAESFGQDAARFGRVLNGMIEGDAAMNISRVRDADAIGSLAEISDLFLEVNESVDEILETSPELFQVKAGAIDIFNDSQILLNSATDLSKKFSEFGGGIYTKEVSLVFTGIALIFLFLIGWEAFRQQKARLEYEENVRREEEYQNQQNQEAILRLLDELGDLADGDLTIQTTVSEDFTGAIADSINFTIDQLRSLVSTINETAVQVSAAAQETQATAMHLAEASEHQAQEIAGASAAVNEMAVSIDQVSANASESAAVAERSVSIANKGAEVVQNTIHGMDTIREQIQETSKRIKRLGESSQEIGDIVSLINDIADQTNILALNAAIQASMAGEAGRGFAVVADEVQRLAERASAATKQIEALVKTIQTDTNEAVISMEQTTSEVVRGARLAQDAGVALEEIENVSANLADLIQNISNAARQQAASAGHISNTMNVIQEITSQTSAGTTATATSIGNLAELAVQMRNSVAGFKLPELIEPEAAEAA